MELIELADPLSIKISRNGIFESLGMITTPKHKVNMLAFLENQKFLKEFLSLKNVSCVIIAQELYNQIPEHLGLICSDNPRKLFYLIHNYLSNHTQFYWKDFESKIDRNAIIDSSAYVAPRNVIIGKNSIIEPNVSILERTIVGENVIIRAGSVIGSQGFEFKRVDNSILSVSHAGSVKIADHVEIQANCAISRGVFDDATEIDEYSKLDNLVHIAHGTKIGKRCLIAASAMIAGSTTIGNDVWIGPSACISNHISIGDRASISLGSVVVQNVENDQRVTGNFAINHRKFLRKFKEFWLSK